MSRGMGGAKPPMPLTSTHFDPIKFAFWTEKSLFQIGATSPNTPLMVYLSERSRKNGTRVDTVRHRG